MKEGPVIPHYLNRNLHLNLEWPWAAQLGIKIKIKMKIKNGGMLFSAGEIVR